MERDSHIPRDPERRPDDQHLRAEIIERLPGTGEHASHRAIEVIGAMMGACVMAHTEGRPLSTEDARGVAHFLALGIDKGTALRDFADGREVDVDEVRSECLELASRPNVYPETREVLNWLDGHLLDAVVPQLRPELPADETQWRHLISYKEDLGLTVAIHGRGDEALFEDGTVLDRAERFALDHGIPGVAYLRLPTTDTSRPDVERGFASDYVGSYADLAELFDTTTRVFQLDDDNHTTPVSYRELSDDARRQLHEGAGEHWSAVAVAGQIHLFKKNHYAEEEITK
ncbi:hypothetical protein AB2L57_05670 [Microbacterium sp. HA-8]|uniref:hypothetical protein n=1 Tax=Microbacterium sp. HA-8 TaxID=3234200 RepID=UPI0038F7CC10